MRKMYDTKRNTKKGFTLLELLAVLVILAALATIAIPIFINKSGTSKQIAHNENVGTLQSQANAYLLSLDTMPATGEELIDDLETKGYIKEIPTNPLTGNKDYSVIYNVTNGTVTVTPIREAVTGVVSGVSTEGSSEYDAVMGCNKPKLVAGMTALNFNGTDFINATAQEITDKTWYNYRADLDQSIADRVANEKWANAKLADGSLFVWIPRYTYNILENSGTSKIWIKYSNGTTDDTSLNASNANTPYKVHPAFNFGGAQLTGIWVAKYEASSNGGLVQVKPGIASWRTISVDAIHTACRAMQTTNSATYGISSDTAVVDTHMMKNSEWGAVAYLTEAIRDRDEIGINDNVSYYTGGSSTVATVYTSVTNKEMSTTGNAYGIYDLNGGAWEYVASYVANGNGNLATYGNSLVTAAVKYKDALTLSPVNTDLGQSGNYTYTGTTLLQTDGMALHEVMSSYLGTSTFQGYADYQDFPYSTYPFFVRGGRYGDGAGAGAFAGSDIVGSAVSLVSFRPVLCGLN
ncbi:MAG TPA: hypothetical protein DEP72_07315 [Clostridiales bacterium]|nr:MAG: hypothetical protein A2Y18_06425 [Clostridiales bacterium GWD2_32_19]HCC07944.1 hypothetical protein [Clostridiales bacterium]